MAAVGPAARPGPGKGGKCWQRGSPFLLELGEPGGKEVVPLLGAAFPWLPWGARGRGRSRPVGCRARLLFN